MKFKQLIGLLLLALSLTGCASLTKIEQPVYADFVVLNKEGSLGQTFVARYDGLHEVAIYLQPDTLGKGTLNLHLRASPEDSPDLATASLSLQEITTPGFYSFQLSALNTNALGQSNRQDYYLLLNIHGAGSVKIGTAPGEMYLNGALYLNQKPQDAQLAFHLVYEPRRALLGLLSEGLSWLLWSAVGTFLFVIPGWAILSLLYPGWCALLWAERLGLSIGLSLVIYPLLLLWTNLIGLNLGALYAWLPPILATSYLLMKNRVSLLAFKRVNTRSLNWVDLALLTTIALIFATRFWAIRSLDVPMWGDSYQHTMMAQLLVDNRGLFDSWQPYAEMSTFTYHFGFHSLVAVFHWISNLTLPQATLWVGQILNCLAVISLYPLAMRIKRNPWGGVTTMLLVGLLLSMPMFYVNWGRYTQLAGQAILPAAICLAWAALASSTHPNWRLNILLWIVLSGLALTHYRVLIFAIIFFVAYFLLNLRKGQVQPNMLQPVSLRSNSIWQMVVGIFWAGVGAILLFLPWFIHVFAGKIITVLSAQLTTPASQSLAFTQQYNAIGDLFIYLPPHIWIILPLAIAWGLWRHERGIALISFWWFFILLATNPQWLKLPGAGVITNFAIFIAAYIPAGLVIGAAAGWLIESLKTQTDHLQISLDHIWRHSNRSKGSATRYSFALTLLAIGIGVWGARQRLNDVNIATYALAVRPDERAAVWLQDHTPEEAYFLVNSFFAYGGSSIVGSDGGWWLPLLAHRQTTLPPLTYTSEQGPRPDYREWVNALTSEIQAKGIEHPDVLLMLQERGVTHIYIGQQQGQVNTPEPLLDPDALLASSFYTPIYHQDRVWLFEFAP